MEGKDKSGSRRGMGEEEGAYIYSQTMINY
jgi:hypothetical protein